MIDRQAGVHGRTDGVNATAADTASTRAIILVRNMMGSSAYKNWLRTLDQARTSGVGVRRLQSSRRHDIRRHPVSNAQKSGKSTNFAKCLHACISPDVRGDPAATARCFATLSSDFQMP
jgi:hypothetical protein